MASLAVGEELRKIEQNRSSRVIAYLTGDKPNFPAKIAPDVIPIFYEHLKSIGRTSKLSLFLYSTGGSLDAPWPLVNLLRQFCDEFEVLVPFRALSAATLVCLGANRIVMSPLSQLSPVDPQGTFTVQGKKVDYMVEDIFSFLDFAKERVGVKTQIEFSKLVEILTNEIKPQILGNINRTYSLIRSLGERMLQLHLGDKENSKKQIDTIVSNLTQQLFSHNHLINRKEAKEKIGFGDIVEYADEVTTQLMDNLLAVYRKVMELDRPFEPKKILKQQDTIAYTIKRSIIQSVELLYTFESDLMVISDSEKDTVNVTQTYQGWRKKKGRKKKNE